MINSRRKQQTTCLCTNKATSVINCIPVGNKFNSTSVSVTSLTGKNGTTCELKDIILAAVRLHTLVRKLISKKEVTQKTKRHM